MELTVSGVRRTYPDLLTVAQLIAAEKVATPEYVSVSVNERFVDTAEFPTWRLSDGDRVEFLYFMGGGAPGAPDGALPEPARPRPARPGPAGREPARPEPALRGAGQRGGPL